MFSNNQASTVIGKPLLIALIIALVGCGSAPKTPALPEEPPKAQETEPQVDSSGPLPLGFWQDRIVEAATSEWVYFGQQIVVIDGDEESIPHVGIWEDDDDSHSDRINLRFPLYFVCQRVDFMLPVFPAVAL